MQHLMVYMTAESPEQARTIADALIARRLVACVNILGDIGSVFFWDNAVQDTTETAFIAKTTQDRFDELAAEVRRLHSYEVPCIVALPIVQGDPAFLEWIETETHQTD